MRHYDSHLSEEDLLLAIDGELAGSRAEQVEEHLAACWDCRTRKQNLEDHREFCGGPACGV